VPAVGVRDGELLARLPAALSLVIAPFGRPHYRPRFVIVAGFGRYRGTIANHRGCGIPICSYGLSCRVNLQCRPARFTVSPGSVPGRASRQPAFPIDRGFLGFWTLEVA
jgi:hypothetical protein